MTSPQPEGFSFCNCSRPDLSTIGDTAFCIGCGRTAQPTSDLQLPPDDDPDSPCFSAADNNRNDDAFEDVQASGYPPLKANQREIRLFSLKPGTPSDPVTGRIFHCVLGSGEQPPYEAISYTWADENGDSTYSHTIVCERVAVRITRNCLSALKKIRRRDESRIIWIDQICIDQTNVAERSFQVGLMSRIYAGATQVLVYLCAPGRDDDAQRSGPAESASSAAEFQDNRILRHPWFTRVWVLQEIANAKKALLLGPRSCIDWGTFRELHLRSRADGSAGYLHDAVPGILRLNLRQFASIQEFPNLLENARGCSASDPRDKVFALYGIMISPSSSGLEANYSKSPEIVFTETALHFIEITGNLSILSHCRPGMSHLNLPSWVPDWSLPPGPSLRDYLKRYAPRIGRVIDKTPPVPFGSPQLDKLVLDSNGNLCIHGRLVDTISGITEPLDFRTTSSKPEASLSPGENWHTSRFQTWSSRGFTVSEYLRSENIWEEPAPEDEIWQLDGADNLFVLRKRDKSYKVVGECFLYGVSYHVCSGFGESLGRCEECALFSSLGLATAERIALC